MRRFTMFEPRSLDEAYGLLSEDDEARPIAGGTALLVMMKLGVFVPSTLVNLYKIGGLRDITFDPVEGLRLGALASVHDVERDPAVQDHYPLLASACEVVANIRIRNLATIGGNVAHADSQSDPPAALLALGASVEVASAAGSRRIALEDFVFGTYETALEPGEVVTAIVVPPPVAGAVGRYEKFTIRSSEDRPSAGVAVWASMANGVCEDVRLVIGAVSPTPVRVQAAEDMARGQRPSAELIDEMAQAAGAAVDPMDDLRGSAAYKRRLSAVLSRRLLTDCLGEGVSS